VRRAFAAEWFHEASDDRLPVVTFGRREARARNQAIGERRMDRVGDGDCSRRDQPLALITDGDHDWHQIVAVFDQLDTHVYVDTVKGGPATEFPYLPCDRCLPQDSPGVWIYAGVGAASGDVDEVSVYNQVLSADQVGEHLDVGLPEGETRIDAAATDPGSDPAPTDPLPPSDRADDWSDFTAPSETTGSTHISRNEIVNYAHTFVGTFLNSSNPAGWNTTEYPVYFKKRLH
jgi:hypothetical protein